MRKKIDEKTYNCVKIMLRGGAPHKEIEEYLQVSRATIGRIKSSESFEDYKQIMAAMAIHFREKAKQEKEPEPPEPEEQPKPEPQVIEHRQTVTIQATHYMMEELRRNNELLVQISAKLAFIVDELTK